MKRYVFLFSFIVVGINLIAQTAYPEKCFLHSGVGICNMQNPNYVPYIEVSDNDWDNILDNWDTWEIQFQDQTGIDRAYFDKSEMKLYFELDESFDGTFWVRMRGVNVMMFPLRGEWSDWEDVLVFDPDRIPTFTGSIDIEPYLHPGIYDGYFRWSGFHTISTLILYDEFENILDFNNVHSEIKHDDLYDFTLYSGKELTLRLHGQTGCGNTPTYVEEKVTIVPVPNLTGQADVCGGSSESYGIVNDVNASSIYYDWSLDPSTAGTITGNGNDEISILWNNSYNGSAKLKTRARIRYTNGSYVYGDYSSEFNVSVTAKPANISYINGPTELCYSSNNRTFEYYCSKSQYADNYSWSITGTGATISKDASDPRKAYVTISSNTTSFTISVNGVSCTSGSQTSKTVTVSNNIDIDFSRVNSCSGQGSIPIDGILPDGGQVWINNFKNEKNLPKVLTLEASLIHGSVKSVNNITTDEDNENEGAIKFSLIDNPNAKVRKAVLILDPFKEATFDGEFGVFTGSVYAGMNIEDWKNRTPITKYSLQDCKINSGTDRFELDVTDIVQKWISGNNNYGFWLKTDGYQYWNTSNAILTVEYYVDDVINTNSVGTTYSVTYDVDYEGCEASETSNITIKPTPAVSFNAPNFCEEELPQSLSGGSPTSGGTGEYSGSFVSEGNMNKCNPGVYPVTYSFTNIYGCLNSVTENVTVYNKPEFEIGGPDDACINSPVTFTVPNPSAYSNYSWKVNNQVISSQQSLTYTPTVSRIDKIEVTVTNGNGCTNTISTEIAVHSSPEVILEDEQICHGDFHRLEPTVYENGSEDISYRWSNGTTARTLDINPTSNVSYSITVTNEYGCSDNDDMNVYILDNPSVTFDDQTVCEGQRATLSAEPYYMHYSYDWSNGYSGNEITVSPSEDGTNNYRVWVTDNNTGCTGHYDGIVYRNPLPSINLPDQDACHGVATTISATPGFVNYTWSTGVTGSSSIQITPYNNQNISCTVVDNNGCENTDNMTLSVHVPQQFSLEALNDEEVCYGNMVYLNGPENKETYRWSNGANTQSTSFQIFNDVNYSLVVTDVYGCEAEDDIFITARSLPSVSINTPTICSGESINLVANPSTYRQYNWDNGAYGYQTTVNPTSNTTYELIVQDDLGCTNTFSTTVTVNPTPVFTLPDQTICFGETATITPSSGGFSQYLWSTGDNSSSITRTASETETISCTVTNQYNCSSAEDMTLTVVQPQSIEIDDIDACVGDIVKIVAPAGFNHYMWSNGVQYQSIDVEALQTTNYTVDVIDLNGCSNSETMTVYANPYPIIEIADFGINEGDPAILSAPEGYSQYTWSTGHTTPMVEVYPTEETLYWVQITTEKGCSSSDSLIVYVYDLPAIDMEDVSICEGGQVEIEAPEDFVKYTWSTGDETRSIIVSPETTTVYSLEVENSTGGKGGAQCVVYVNSKPSASLDDVSICLGESTTLTTYNDPTYRYEWSHISDNINTCEVSPGISTNYNVTVTDENNCKKSATAKIEVQAPQSGFFVSQEKIRPGDVVQFYIENKNDFDSLYTWNFGDGYSNKGNNPMHVYNTEGIFNVSLSVLTKLGCTSETVKESYVLVNENIIIGVDETNTLGLRIYPNPFQDHLFIDASDYDLGNKIKISIVDIAGKRVYNEELQNSELNSIDLTELEPGTYSMLITVNDIQTTQTIIKLK